VSQAKFSGFFSKDVAVQAFFVLVMYSSQSLSRYSLGPFFFSLSVVGGWLFFFPPPWSLSQSDIFGGATLASCYEHTFFLVPPFFRRFSWFASPFVPEALPPSPFVDARVPRSFFFPPPRQIPPLFPSFLGTLVLSLAFRQPKGGCYPSSFPVLFIQKFG